MAQETEEGEIKSTTSHHTTTTINDTLTIVNVTDHRTQIIGLLLGGQPLYDQSFGVAFDDPLVQGGVRAARLAITNAGMGRASSSGCRCSPPPAAAPTRRASPSKCPAADMTTSNRASSPSDPRPCSSETSTLAASRWCSASTTPTSTCTPKPI
ncbi:hypothetical protein [Sphingopyxis sp. PET50]|uniref:hypothetical protein n=1 Tax=Sphingopyxis sp. PET50 TaxID=2976533 RepID=UPI0021B000C2|nr:hypothetical protein [Sphingopyxis sp. PET50]